MLRRAATATRFPVGGHTWSNIGLRQIGKPTRGRLSQGQRLRGARVIGSTKE